MFFCTNCVHVSIFFHSKSRNSTHFVLGMCVVKFATLKKDDYEEDVPLKSIKSVVRPKSKAKSKSLKKKLTSQISTQGKSQDPCVAPPNTPADGLLSQQNNLRLNNQHASSSTIISKNNVKSDDKANGIKWNATSASRNFVLTSTGSNETDFFGQIEQLSTLSGCENSPSFTPAVTHVVVPTSVDEPAKRTIKFLQGVVSGKWIVSYAWVSACLAANEFVDEAAYEVRSDTSG